MAIKKTLLEIVQEILSDLDSEDVNSISDTLEAEQVARMVESTYYNIIATRHVPEHAELIKLTALSDTDFPTHFSYPDNVKRIEVFHYDTSDDDSFEYEEVKWLDPMDFLARVDGVQSNYDSVLDKNAGTHLRIQNNKKPEYYTSFDDYYIVCDSYDSTVDTTLQESKSVAFSLLKGGSDPKVEQAARRQKSYIQNDRYRTVQGKHWNDYGRKPV